MIVVRVELWPGGMSSNKRELARMHIANGCKTTIQNPNRGDYSGHTFVGRDSAALDRGQVSKEGQVLNYPRKQLHVWNLVARMLASMGYQ